MLPYRAGPVRQDTLPTDKTIGSKESITLIGGRPHHEIPLWIGACDAFVLPSLMEGNPTVMFECLGAGRPFIGTRVWRDTGSDLFNKVWSSC